MYIQDLGLHIVENAYLEEVLTLRTWRERLLSWPWKPWVTHKVEKRFAMKDGEVYQMGDKFIMNPNTRAHFIEQLKRVKS